MQVDVPEVSDGTDYERRPDECKPEVPDLGRAAECLASCGSGPVLQVDRRYHERVTPQDVDAILDRLLGEGDADSTQP